MNPNKVYVYGWRHTINGMMNIGYKSPNGQDMYTYISSIRDNSQFWHEHSHGLVTQFILFEGDASQDNVAKTLEWFALDYGMAVAKGKFYNAKNNAHCVDESLLTTEMKKVVVDFIEGRGNGLPIKRNEDATLVEEIHKNIKAGAYIEHKMAISDVMQTDYIQVRVERIKPSHVREIKNRMISDPANARKTFSPITLVVKSDGSRMLIDGNHRLHAAAELKGWKEVPVIFINENEFGDTEESRLDNYELFGIVANKDSFEVKEENTSDDIKRSINNYLYRHKLDLTNPIHLDRARDLVYSRWAGACNSKQQLNGVLVSLLKDLKKHQAGLKYQDNLIVYNEAFLKSHCWDNYGINNRATITDSVSSARFAASLGKIIRRMRNLNVKQGAIVLHYQSKPEIANEESECNVDDMISAINFMGLDIVVEVLPPFAEE
jgi:hypothetical protein